MKCNAHLADDVPVGESYNHPVFRSIVLVLVLNHQTLAGKEVRFTLWKEAHVSTAVTLVQSAVLHAEMKIKAKVKRKTIYLAFA